MPHSPVVTAVLSLLAHPSWPKELRIHPDDFEQLRQAAPEMGEPLFPLMGTWTTIQITIDRNVPRIGS